MCYYSVDWNRLEDLRREDRAARLGLTLEELDELDESYREAYENPEPKPLYKTVDGVDMVLTDSGVYEQITD